MMKKSSIALEQRHVEIIDQKSINLSKFVRSKIEELEA